MFIRIYLGIITSLILASAGSYILFNQINHHRLIEYNQNVFGGTFKLIQEGLARHEGQKQLDWLNIVNRLSGLKLKIISRESAKLTKTEYKVLLSGTAVFRRKDDSGYFDIVAAVPGQKDQVLSSTIKNVAEQQLRVAALLLLNELGRFPPAEHSVQLQRLQKLFSFSIKLAETGKLNLDNDQRRRLSKNNIVVSWQTDTYGKETLLVYAAYSTNIILVLGPIKPFDTVPMLMLISLLAFSLLISGTIAYLLVYRLEKRLQHVSKVVAQFGPGYLNTRVDEEGKDAIGQLGETVNGMAERIEALLAEQKYITQAVSHDLRTPMSRLRFRLDMLENTQNEQQRQEKIQGIRKDIDELHTLVDEILLYHQLDTNLLDEQSTKSEHGSINIGDLFTEIGQQMSVIVPNKKLSLDMSHSTTVNAHPFFLRRLAQNLIDNGLRYARETLLIKYIDNGDDYTIVFEDDGEGIPKEHWSTIFDPFTRIDSSRNKKLGGYGLGLAIVKRIAAMHSGSIKVEQSRLGGAKFTFQWPKSDKIQ